MRIWPNLFLEAPRMNADRLAHQMNFINELEKLKLVCRRNLTLDPARFENSAEHSWHVSMMAVILHEHVDKGSSDLLKVVKMLLIHDVVEIYAGDTWLYEKDNAGRQAQSEGRSADKLFALLPEDQSIEFRSLWEEFEARDTAEARFAAAIDALQPLSNHLLTGDADSLESKPSKDEVAQKKRHIAASSEALWTAAREIIETSARRGLYRES